MVTGANSGIGWHVARALAARGARVVLACRNADKAKYAVERIATRVPGAQVDTAELDLASVSSVREFSHAWTGPLDLLVNNAAVMYPPKLARTQDGYELQFGTNHLGHFVLTGLLLPTLLASTAPRVVTVCSLAHHGGTDAVGRTDSVDYNPKRAYANSKLANLLFAQELHRQASRRALALSSVAAHPGLAATGLFADPQGMGASAVVRAVAPIVVRAFAQSAAAGAAAVLHAATVAASGSYVGPQRLGETRGAIGPARMSELAQNERLAHLVWRLSEDLTGFRYPWPPGP